MKLIDYPLFFCLLLTACSAPEEPDQEVAPEAAVAYLAPGEFSARPKVILDADTGNEIDDLFAIARALPDTSIDLLGLSSAQWFSAWSGDSTVYESQRLNEELLDLTGRMDLPHPLGADSMMGKPWGDYDPRPSPATVFMIEQVKALPDGEKLVVLSTGAATNLASAIAIDSTIVPQIVVYLLGFQYNFAEGYWNKDEFNIRRDLNAANFLLNQQDLELHIMPISVAIEYSWDRKDTFNRLSKAESLGEYLKNRWQSFSPDATRWIMWDVALLQAFLHPELAQETTVMTPPENTQRKVFMYTDIDFDGMYRDFWSGL